MNPNDAPALTCAHFLDNGQPCQAPARRGDSFCRHHDPDVLQRRHPAASAKRGRRAAQPSAESGELSPWTLRAYWRIHHRLIPACGPEDLDTVFAMILEALGERQIAPRSAGRLILAILDRRRQLADETQIARIRALGEQSRRSAPSPAASAVFDHKTAASALAEALDEIPSFQGADCAKSYSRPLTTNLFPVSSSLRASNRFRS